MTMPRLTADEILQAIRQLPAEERETLLDRLFEEEIVETPEDMIVLEAALDRADRGEFIEDDDLEAYMAARRKERRGLAGEH